MKKLFGTDGVRGKTNRGAMIPETALQLGRAAAYIFKKDNHRKHRVVIGKDTRLSGYLLESALTSGICSMGVDVLLVGPVPTPAIAFITRSLRADAGVVISGSHNRFDDNGIKFFSSEGMKLPDATEKKIEKAMYSGVLDNIRPTGGDIGKAHRVFDVEGRYIEFVKNSLPKGMDFAGMKVVIDCANGAAYKVSPSVLSELGANIIPIGDRPNGVNINLNCGSLHPEVIQKEVLAHGADIGIAHDGDADRVVLVSDKGDIIDGDFIMAIAAKHMKKKKMLSNDTVVATVMSNLGLEIAMEQSGIKLLRTNVGDRYVLEEMVRGNYNLGGEQSGHIIFLDYNTTGDGLISALQILSLMQETGKPLSELATCMTRYPQVIKNIPVKEKTELNKIPNMDKAVSAVEKTLGKKGRCLIRYSGTEPLLRIMIEGEDQAQINKMAENLADVVLSQKTQ